MNAPPSRRTVVSFIIAAALASAVYFPSLFHTARSDQINYLIEQARVDDWPSLALGSYGFNRHRVFEAGDQLLFRPVFYFILGTEKWMLGYHFIAWQLIGILLHLAVLWQLLRFLRARGLNLFALLLTCFFAVLPPCLEMVIWHHIHSYQVFALLMLIALNRLPMDGDPPPGKRDLRVIATCCLFATFIHESGAVFSLLFAAYLWLSQKTKSESSATETDLQGNCRAARGRVPQAARLPLTGKTTLRDAPWIVAAPGLLYPILSFLDYQIVGVTLSKSAPETMHWDIVQTLANMAVAAAWWCYAGFFPTTLTFSGNPVNRIGLPPEAVLFPSLTHFPGPLVSLSIAAALIAVAAWFFSLRRSVCVAFLSRRRLPILLFVTMIATHVGMIAAGRMNARGAAFILKTNLYYSYIFWILLILLAVTLVDLQRLSIPRWVRGLAVASLVWLTAVNGHLVYRINAGFAEQCRPIRMMVAEVNTFVSRHRYEPGLSIFIAPATPGNPVILSTKDQAGATTDYTLVEVLYPQYFRKQDARYKFDGRTWVTTGIRQESGGSPHSQADTE